MIKEEKEKARARGGKELRQNLKVELCIDMEGKRGRLSHGKGRLLLYSPHHHSSPFQFSENHLLLQNNFVTDGCIADFHLGSNILHIYTDSVPWNLFTILFFLCLYFLKHHRFFTYHLRTPVI